MHDAINLYSNMISAAIPYATVFAIGNLIVNSILNAAFRGRLSFR